MLQVSGLVSIEYSYTAHKMVQSYDIVKKNSFYLFIFSSRIHFVNCLI